MIFELTYSEFPRVLPLYRKADLHFPLISAVIQQQQRGQVFVDEPGSPTSAMVITDFGFTFFVGAEQNQSFDDGLGQLLANGQAIKPSYLLWYSPPIHWQRKLDEADRESVKKRERVRLEFGVESADGLPDQVVSPEGFHFEDLTMELIPKTEKFGVKLDSRFWPSAEECVEKSLGVCLLKDDQIVSLCYAAAAVDNLAEVDVATMPEFRERGLASLTAQRFARKCLRNGVMPTWDCFDYNAGSIKLARRLGLVEAVRYPFYSFNVPLKTLKLTDWRSTDGL